MSPGESEPKNCFTATGNPITSSNTTSRSAQFGISKERKNLAGDLHEQPRHNAIRDGDLVNVAPFELSEKILRIHRVRLFTRVFRSERGRDLFETRITAKGIPERMQF
jgi:hypothetical protein